MSEVPHRDVCRFQKRFSTRVADYVRYRPGYPHRRARTCCTSECGLLRHTRSPTSVRARDFSASCFCKMATPFSASSPTRKCARPAKNISPLIRRFTASTRPRKPPRLKTASVDFVTAGQAFHWFEPDATRREFARILEAGRLGRRDLERSLHLGNPASPTPTKICFVRFGTDYARVKEPIPKCRTCSDFFGRENFLSRANLPNFQDLRFRRAGRAIRSSSYAPEEGQPNFAPMMAALDNLFRTNISARIGRVRMEFSTQSPISASCDPGERARHESCLQLAEGFRRRHRVAGRARFAPRAFRN